MIKTRQSLQSRRCLLGLVAPPLGTVCHTHRHFAGLRVQPFMRGGELFLLCVVCFPEEVQICLCYNKRLNKDSSHLSSWVSESLGNLTVYVEI